MFESQNYSAKFIDFLKECLMFDPKNRMKAFDILSHPVFRKYNKVYISQQIVMTSPITKVEKHNLQKLRCISRNLQQNSSRTKKSIYDEFSQRELYPIEDIKIQQLLDIIKIKVKYEKKMSFLQFLMHSFSQISHKENEIFLQMYNQNK